MTGVEILAIEEVVVAYEFSWVAYFITIALITIGFSFISLADGVCIENLILGIAVGLVFGIILGLIPAMHTTPSEYTTECKVTISDEVSMKDFLERYEIMDQEGKIYTVRERDGVEE